MKNTLLLFLFCFTCHAQFSWLDTNGGNGFNVSDKSWTIEGNFKGAGAILTNTNPQIILQGSSNGIDHVASYLGWNGGGFYWDEQTTSNSWTLLDTQINPVIFIQQSLAAGATNETIFPPVTLKTNLTVQGNQVNIGNLNITGIITGNGSGLTGVPISGTSVTNPIFSQVGTATLPQVNGSFGIGTNLYVTNSSCTGATNFANWSKTTNQSRVGNILAVPIVGATAVAGEFFGDINGSDILQCWLSSFNKSVWVTSDGTLSTINGISFENGNITSDGSGNTSQSGSATALTFDLSGGNWAVDGAGNTSQNGGATASLFNLSSGVTMSGESGSFILSDNSGGACRWVFNNGIFSFFGDSVLVPGVGGIITNLTSVAATNFYGAGSGLTGILASALPGTNVNNCLFVTNTAAFGVGRTNFGARASMKFNFSITTALGGTAEVDLYMTNSAGQITSNSCFLPALTGIAFTAKPWIIEPVVDPGCSWTVVTNGGGVGAVYSILKTQVTY
jgi:hypothetical protein